MNMVKQLLLSFSLLFSIIAQAQYDNALDNSATNGDEGEAHIAISPIDSSKMVTGFMRSRAGLSFHIYSSQDGGDTWQASTFTPIPDMQNDLPGYSVIGGGDIVFAYDLSGDLYCSWISLWSDLSSNDPLDSCLWKAAWAKSTDNGASFTMQSGSDRYFAEGLVNLSAGQVYNFADGIADRQWMAIDYSNSSHRDKLYVGYINYPSNLQQTGLKIKTKTPASNSFSSETVAYSGNGQLTNIAIDGNGVLHYSFADIVSNTINHVSSSDGAQNFSPTHQIFSGQALFPRNNNIINDRENAAPSLAIDGSNNLHLVWGDFPVGQTLPESYYSYSTDGGTNWSTPVQLSTIFGKEVFMPVVSAKNDRISIGGHLVETDKKSDYYIALSDDNGQNFAPPVKMSSGITDFSTLMQRFVGDYSSSVRTYCNIFSLWTDCRNGCKQYVAKYDQCANVGLIELTPIESSFSLKSIYPNPTVDFLNIEVKSETNDRLTVDIIDAKGSILKSLERDIVYGKNDLSISVSQFNPGNFFIRLTNTDGTYFTRTFIKD